MDPERDNYAGPGPPTWRDWALSPSGLVTLAVVGVHVLPPLAGIAAACWQVAG